MRFGARVVTAPAPPPPSPFLQGAVYLDGDLDAVRAIYTSHFPLPADPLTLLQPDGTGGLPPAPSGGGGSGNGGDDSSPWAWG